MRILLQDKKTGLYLEKSGVLTLEIEAAEDFGDSQRAIEYARSERVSGVQVVAAFPGTACVDSVTFDIGPVAARTPWLLAGSSSTI